MRREKLFYMNLWIQEDEKNKIKSIVKKSDDVAFLKILKI
jgi:hypothetical protein